MSRVQIPSPAFMRETGKCSQMRLRRGDFDRYLIGSGIDIGAGGDLLKITNGTVKRWDKSEGDAQLMEGVKDESFDFVYSSHCLEHMKDVEIALRNWIRILKPGGRFVHMLDLTPYDDYTDDELKTLLRETFGIDIENIKIQDPEDIVYFWDFELPWNAEKLLEEKYRDRASQDELYRYAMLQELIRQRKGQRPDYDAFFIIKRHKDCAGFS